MPDPITLQTSTGHYLTAELDGTLAANRLEAGPWEQWTVEPVAPGVYALQSCHGGYLSAYTPEHAAAMGLPPHTAAATGYAAYAWEHWTVTAGAASCAVLQGCHGLWLRAEGGGGSTVDAGGAAPGPWEQWIPSDLAAFGLGGSGSGEPTGGPMRPLEGDVRPAGRSFTDATGARLVHGCSDFAALVKYHEDPDGYLRQLDVTAGYQQYTRILWRLNGWKWADSGLTVDPIRDPWFESALCAVLEAHQARGLKVNLSSGDMNHWTDSQAEEWFRRVAQIAADFGDVVWLSGCTNEMEGTWAPGECEDNIERGHALMQMWRGIYPGGCWAVSDPKDRDQAGMEALAGNVALIHDTRWEIADAIRHAFNSRYENDPGVPIVQDEPTGPNGSPPHSDFTRLVYQPIEDPDELAALYTMHVLTGQASTYFNDPALVSRQPLDSTWGFKELPALWRALAIPEAIGQGALGAGHTGAGMMQVTGSHAARADGASHGGYHLGVISGAWDGQPWAVRANVAGTWSTWYADGATAGPAWEGRLSEGQVIPTPRGFTPAIVRCLP